MRWTLGIAVLVALWAGGCSDEPPPAYDAAFEADFSRECEAGVGRGGAEACACWYERVSAEVEFDELPALDDLMAPSADEETVDPALYDQLADCVRAFGAPSPVPPTAPPPLTVPLATTTTAPAATIAPEG